MKEHEPELYTDLLCHAEKTEMFSKQMMDDYRREVKRPCMSDGEVAEELLADAFADRKTGRGQERRILAPAPALAHPVRRRRVLQDMAKANPTLVQRLAAFTQRSAFQRVEKLHESKGGLTGLSTGFRDLDKLTYGLTPSDFIIVAARPSMGKTAFVLNIATYVALRQQKSVAFFSLEMSEEQLTQRILCAEAGIDSGRMQTGTLEDEDWDRMIKAGDRLSQAQLHIDDTASISVMELRTKARRVKAEQGLDLIIIDYLQLMQGKAGDHRDNRQQEISGISRSLKALARELKIPVVALSQLSRSVESRPVKKPLMSDLRESGSLEQDADLVMLLYREDYYEEDTPDKNIAEVIVAKHRNGPVGTVRLFFQKEFTRFMNMGREYA